MDDTEPDADEDEVWVGWLDRTVTLPRGELLALLCLALSWKFDGTWGAAFTLSFWALALWMLFGQ